MLILFASICAFAILWMEIMKWTSTDESAREKKTKKKKKKNSGEKKMKSIMMKHSYFDDIDFCVWTNEKKVVRIRVFLT